MGRLPDGRQTRAIRRLTGSIAPRSSSAHKDRGVPDHGAVISHHDDGDIRWGCGSTARYAPRIDRAHAPHRRVSRSDVLALVRFALPTTAPDTRDGALTQRPVPPVGRPHLAWRHPQRRRLARLPSCLWDLGSSQRLVPLQDRHLRLFQGRIYVTRRESSRLIADLECLAALLGPRSQAAAVLAVIRGWIRRRCGDTAANSTYATLQPTPCRSAGGGGPTGPSGAYSKVQVLVASTTAMNVPHNKNGPSGDDAAGVRSPRTRTMR
jgi:hypothetical protein